MNVLAEIKEHLLEAEEKSTSDINRSIECAMLAKEKATSNFVRESRNKKDPNSRRHYLEPWQKSLYYLIIGNLQLGDLQKVIDFHKEFESVLSDEVAKFKLGKDIIIDDVIKANLLRISAYAYSMIPEGNHELIAKELGDEALKIYDILNDKIGIAKTCNALGSIYLNSSKKEYYSAYHFFIDGLVKLGKPIKPKEKEIASRVNNNLALLFQQFQNYEKAEDYSVKAIEFSEELYNAPFRMVQAASYFLNLSEKKNKEEKKLLEKQLEEVFDIIEIMVNPEINIIDYTEFLYLKASYKFEKKQYSEAYKLAVNCFEILEEFNIQTVNYHSIKCIICASLVELNKHEEAINLYEEDIRKINVNEYKDHAIISVFKVIQDAYVGQNDFLKALWASKQLANYLISQKITLASNNVSNIQIKGLRDILFNIMPYKIALELIETEEVKPQKYKSATVIFTDFVGFSHIAKELKASQLLEQLEVYFGIYDKIIGVFGVEKIKTIGDAYLIASGVPEENKQHAQNAVKTAIAILYATKLIAAISVIYQINEGKENRIRKVLKPFDIRIGIHSGKLVAGMAGVKNYAYDIWGEAVNRAARIEQGGEKNKIFISSKTKDLLVGNVLAKEFFINEEEEKSIKAKNYKQELIIHNISDMRGSAIKEIKESVVKIIENFFSISLEIIIKTI